MRAPPPSPPPPVPRRARHSVRLASFDNAADVQGVCQLVSMFAAQQQTTADVESLQQFLPSFTSGFTLVAVDADDDDDGRLCGYAMCCMMMSSFAGGQTLNLHDIYVREEYRGQGVGQALIDAVCDEGKRRGCKKLTLEAHEVNVRARQFYERNGFECYDAVRSASVS